MTIIKIEALQSGQHPIESQSGRTSCWLDGYIEVPEDLVSKVVESLGWCNLDIQDGVLVGITLTERLEIPNVPEQLSVDERIKKLEAQNTALISSNQLLENCIVEMAAMVYA